MDALTPAERRGALVVVCLLALGAGHDLWRASRPLPGPDTAAAPTVEPTRALGFPDGVPAAPESGARGTARGEPPTLDLNRATAVELDALPGIGPVLAERIIDHRRRHGPFGSREELLAVRGIGPRLLARLGARVDVVPRRSPGGRDSLSRPR